MPPTPCWTGLRCEARSFKSASDIDAEALALEALRKAFIEADFTSDTPRGLKPGEPLWHLYMQIRPLWEWLKALPDTTDDELLRTQIRGHRGYIAGVRSRLDAMVVKPDTHEAVLERHPLAKDIMAILARKSPLTEPGIKTALKSQLKKEISDSTLGKTIMAMRKCEPPMIWNKRQGKDRGYRPTT